MGTPAHYASELPHRLGFLIDHLYPMVEKGLPGDHKFGGALGTTFLLAMATPMIVLPMERILRAQGGKQVMADDNLGNPRLAQHVAALFAKGQRFDQAPFAKLDGWSYVAGHVRFDVGNNWPQALLDGLDTPKARADVRAADTRQILTDLRNALSHGGITYLNGDGRHVYGDEVVMFAFAAQETIKGDTYNIVRVTERAFRTFLSEWSAWLTKP